MKSTLNLSTQRPKLFMGLPTYGWQRMNTMALIAAHQKQQSFSRIIAQEINTSLLASAFNQLLAAALDYRDQGHVDYFLLLHADIKPVKSVTWLDDLWAAKQSVNANVISAISPIKDTRGLTSTGIENHDSIYAPRRLTMAEVMAMPETFTDPDLLVNTGMLLFDLRLPWVDTLCFTIGDAIFKNTAGKRIVGVTPEDWNFSRHARAAGETLWATRAVPLFHCGAFDYPNGGVWGTEATDPGDQKA